MYKIFILINYIFIGEMRTGELRFWRNENCPIENLAK